MTVDEFVVEKISAGEFMPMAWMTAKGGPLHVEEQPGVSLCGVDRPETPFAFGPARPMLRRVRVCVNCEKGVPDEPEDG